MGLYAALVARSFEEAVGIAANHDGDSDSTASIAGQLHGVWKGVGAVPHRWARHIDVLVPLLRLTRDLLARHHAGAWRPGDRHEGWLLRRRSSASASVKPTTPHFVTQDVAHRPRT